MDKQVGFECKRCGKCCARDWDLRLDPSTIVKWMREKRSDLLYHIVFHPRFLLHPEYSDYEPILIIDNGHILFGDRKHKCPFLITHSTGKTSCRIHNDKPLVCKEFPLSVEADGKEYVRTDMLDFCSGTRDYFEKCARIAGKSLAEHMRSVPEVKAEGESIPIPPDLAAELKKRYESLTDEEKATGLVFPELRDEKYREKVFRRLAKIYKRLHLKVRITSESGLAILMAYAQNDIEKMKQIIGKITNPAEDAFRTLLQEQDG